MMFDMSPIEIFFFVLFVGPYMLLGGIIILAALPGLIAALPCWVIFSLITAGIDLWDFTKMSYTKIKSGEAWASLKQFWNSCCRR